MIVSGGSHSSGELVPAGRLQRGNRDQSGGNGVTGSDETSEDLSVTWELAMQRPQVLIQPAADWVINEIHADPGCRASPGDANGDGVRDFYRRRVRRDRQRQRRRRSTFPGGRYRTPARYCARTLPLADTVVAGPVLEWWSSAAATPDRQLSAI